MTTQTQNANTNSNTNTTGTQNTQSTSTTDPYASSLSALNSFIGNLSGLSAAPTGNQQSAASAWGSALDNSPNFGGQVGQQAGAFLGGDPYGILGSGLTKLNSTLSPLTDWSKIDPSTNPATADLIAAIKKQTTDPINAMFAGAGRDLSGANTAADTTAFTQALAPTLFGQYNQNIQNLMNAGSQMFGASNTANNTMANNVNQGLGLAAAQPGIATAPAQAQQAAANNQAMLPFQNSAALASLLLPIASQWGTTTNTGTANTDTSSNTNANTTVNSTPSLFSSLLSGLGLFSGGSNSSLSGLSKLLGI